MSDSDTNILIAANVIADFSFHLKIEAGNGIIYNNDTIFYRNKLYNEPSPSLQERLSKYSLRDLRTIVYLYHSTYLVDTDATWEIRDSLHKIAKTAIAYYNSEIEYMERNKV